jgi:hypothetical protein
MIRHVFRRMQKGKRSAYWTGRYAFKRGDKPREVATGLTDKAAALAFLDKFATEEQRAAVGILPARSYREAAAAPLGALLDSGQAPAIPDWMTKYASPPAKPGEGK